MGTALRRVHYRYRDSHKAFLSGQTCAYQIQLPIRPSAKPTQGYQDQSVPCAWQATLSSRPAATANFISAKPSLQKPASGAPTGSNMDYSQYGNTGYSYPPGYTDSYAQQQQQQYQATPPQIRNPFGPPPPPRNAAYANHNANYDPEYDAALSQWQSAYAPPEEQERNKRNAKGEKGPNPNTAPIGVRAGPQQEAAEANAKTDHGDKKKTVVRKGGGQTWEDQTLLEWDPTQFRIMVGNLAGEVTDDSLAKAFANYGVSKARVVRDKRTTKSRGYGFVSFTDGEQGSRQHGRWSANTLAAILLPSREVRPTSSLSCRRTTSTTRASRTRTRIKRRRTNRRIRYEHTQARTLRRSR